MSETRSEKWHEAMGLIHNLEANAHMLGLMRENPGKYNAKPDDVTHQRENVTKMKRRLMDLVTELDKLAHPEPRQFEQRSWPPKEIIPLPQTLEEASDQLQKITERRLLKRMAPLVFNMPFELTPEQEKEFSERSELLKGQMELYSKLMDNALRRFIESLEKERVNGTVNDDTSV